MSSMAGNKSGQNSFKKGNGIWKLQYGCCNGLDWLVEIFDEIDIRKRPWGRGNCLIIYRPYTFSLFS